MTSGDMKIELNEDREIGNTIPDTLPNINYSKINPNSYDRNIEEISFEDFEQEYDPNYVFLGDEPEDEYEPPKRFR